MIVVDLVHYATHQEEHLVLVSGDDDMWPGIRICFAKRGTHHPHNSKDVEQA